MACLREADASDGRDPRQQEEAHVFQVSGAVLDFCVDEGCCELGEAARGMFCLRSDGHCQKEKAAEGGQDSPGNVEHSVS